MERLAKPVDVGTGVVCASFAEDGSWLSIGRIHPRWGFVELNGLPPFDERTRGDPAATRRYRGLMASATSAFLRVEPAAAGRPFAAAHGTPGSPWLVQRWQLGDGIARVVRVAGRLDRPALAQITEVDPPPPTGAVTELRAEGGRLLVRAAGLPAIATVDASVGRWTLVDGGAELRLAGDEPAVDISVALEPGLDPPSDPLPSPASWAPGAVPFGGIETIIERARTYVRSCTALACETGERAMLTDHRLLPLAWTRDAYWQALLLLAGGTPTEVAIVADHLRWTWRRCERPGGRWMRSHHGNGEPKDLVFQADQQLYPFVELADYWRTTGTLPDGVAWEAAVSEGWRVVVAAIDPITGLLATDENAADDRAELPFVAGIQVLLWYAAMRLAEPGLAVRLGLAADELLEVATGIRGAFDRHFVTGERWPYAVDGPGRTIDYHDANELPTALAPLWGFCAGEDPGWRATIQHAFSPGNPGFVAGPSGGLGSVHTPGVWPLGHVQAWLVGRILGDDARAARALDRLEQAAFSDGMLPEALVEDGEATVPVRHWFAWPGAALGALWLLDRRESLRWLAARQG